MKFVLAHPGPNFSVHDVYVGWAEGLRELGHVVVPFNLHDRLSFYDSTYFNVADNQFRKAISGEQAVELAVNGLYATLYKVVPDVLLVVSGFLIPPSLLDHARRYGTRVVIVHTEEPYETTRQAALAEHADINIVNDPVNLDRFPGGTYYQPHCYRPALHHPGPADPDLAADLAFVGTGFASRIALFEEMAAAGAFDGLDVLLAGNWQQLTEDSPLGKYLGHDAKECLDNDQAATIYRSAKVGINFYRREHDGEDHAQGWAIGPREVEMAACGLPFLRDPRGEGDALFPHHPTFTDAQEAAADLRWWIENPNRRAEAALAARAAVAERTFTQAAVRLLQHIEKENLL